MKKYSYLTLEDDDRSPKTITITEEEILKDYFPRWSERMRSRNLDDEINQENCIKDFVRMYWAWEV